MTGLLTDGLGSTPSSLLTAGLASGPPPPSPAAAPNAVLTRGLGSSPPRLVVRGFGASAAPAPPAPDFWAAFVAWFRSDAALTAAFPGGVVAARAAPKQVYPYARLWDAEPTDPTSPDDAEVAFTLSAYAASDAAPFGDDQAAAGGRLLVAKLQTDPDRPTLRFALAGRPWREVGCLWEPPAKLQQVGRAAGGVDVWRYDVNFRAFLTSDE